MATPKLASSSLLRASRTAIKPPKPAATPQRRTRKTAASITAAPAVEASSETTAAVSSRPIPGTARILDKKGKGRADPLPSLSTPSGESALDAAAGTKPLQVVDGEPVPSTSGEGLGEGASTVASTSAGAQASTSTSTSVVRAEPVTTASDAYLSLIPPSNRAREQPYTTVPLARHAFSTYRIVDRLERAGFETPVAQVFMRATKQLLLHEEQRAASELVAKSDLENEAYLFSAALSELRTEVQVQARNDAIAQQSANALLQREVDSLSQRMREDMQGLKNDIQLDINNRKDETAADLKALELKISELSGKFTSLLGDVRTEVEDVKLDTTRNFMLLIGMGVLAVIVTDPFKPKPEPVKVPSAGDLGVEPLPSERDATAGAPAWLSNWAQSGKRVGEDTDASTAS